MKIYKGDLIIECTTEEYLELKDVLYKPKSKTSEGKGVEKPINRANTCLEKDWYMKFFSSPNYD